MTTGKFTLVIDYASDADTDVAARLDRATKYEVIRHVQTDLNAIVGGSKRARIFGCVSSVFASQTVACVAADAVANTDTLTVAGTALAAKASVANQSQFLIGATDTAYAANVAACINAHTTLQKIVKATSSAGTLTIQCKVPGPIGNALTLAEAGNGFTLGGATLAGGASDEVDEYTFGFTPDP